MDKTKVQTKSEPFPVYTTTAQFETISVENTMVVPCLICGEYVPVSMFDNHTKICENCKKAILKLRKMLEED